MTCCGVSLTPLKDLEFHELRSCWEETSLKQNQSFRVRKHLAEARETEAAPQKTVYGLCFFGR